jgi:D-alanine-D-alanine ligase
MEENKKRTVALIYGGRGCESGISVLGAERILPLIDRKKYKPVAVFIDGDGRWLFGGGQVAPSYTDGVGGFLVNGEMLKVDCAIPLLHGDFGEDGVVQGALENARIPFVGSDCRAGAITNDKSVLKAVASSLEIPTLPHILLTDESELSKCTSLSFPLFVKPCRLGSSYGAMRASDGEQLRVAVRNALSLCSRVMVEPCLDEKRELECGYFNADGREMLTDVGEIVCQSGFYSYDKKYLGCTDTRIRSKADIDPDTLSLIREYSSRLIHAVGVRDLCRVDFFLCGNKLYLNEINSVPGFTEGSMFPMLAEQSGYPLATLLDRLIEGAVRRGA